MSTPPLPMIFDKMSLCILPELPCKPKIDFVEHSNVNDTSDINFSETYLPPTIETNTVLSERPHILFRTVGGHINSYNIFDIVKRIKCGEKKFGENLIKEMALNNSLKSQLSKNKNFSKWVVQSEKYLVPTNFNANL